MAVRYPLVIDTTDNNKIKELPANDSLNLNTNSIVNAVNITASGTLTVANLVVDSNSVSINGNPLGTVALTNSYTDLSNTPSLFDGTYAALTGRPSIPASTEDLSDVGSTQATNGQALIYDTSLGRYEPGNIADASIDLTNQDLGELQNVVLTGAVANQILKYNGTAFVNTTVHFSEITNKPTTLAGFGITDAQLAGAPHDGDIIGSVFGDDSTLLVDGVNNKIVGAVDTASLRTSESEIALGYHAGQTTQGAQSVAIGHYAGNTSQGGAAVAIGRTAGQTTQGTVAIAIGYFAGNTSQGGYAVAIGRTAGYTSQGAQSVAVGFEAGKTNQGEDAVAIGHLAGYDGQGENAIAIGQKAGQTNQAANSIVLNATGATVENTTASSLVITPIRSAVGTTMLMYDVTSGEVTHTASPAITGDFTGSVFGDDSTVLVDGVNNTLHGVVLGGMQVIAGPGVINLTTTSTEIITTGTDAFTLANGVSGQIKHIIKMGGSSTATITPASFANGTSIELNATYDTVSLLYTTGGWVVTAGQSFTINA